MLDRLIDSADTLIVGGGMAYTFFLAQGYTVGTSLQEPDYVDEAKKLLQKAEDKGVELLLPVDNVVTDDFDNPTVKEVVDSNKIPDDRMGMDIGTKTRELYADGHQGRQDRLLERSHGRLREATSSLTAPSAVAEAVAEVKG